MNFYRLIGWLPFPLLYILAGAAYLVTYYIAGYRKGIVRENLRCAFPDRNERELTVLAKMYYRQLAQVALEIIKARRMTREEFRRRVTLRNPELLRQYSDDFHNSFIILTIHQGNWEWMLHGITATLDIPLDPIYKPLHNAAADNLVYEVRSRFGSRPIPVASATRDLLRHRRQFRALAMVADQAPTRRERSYWTTFMNREAPFHPGAENIARLTGFPVIFAQCRRLRRGYYEIEFHPLGEPGPEEENTLTERYVRMAERAIREEPGSWLWSNRRWKRRRALEQA